MESVLLAAAAAAEGLRAAAVRHANDDFAGAVLGLFLQDGPVDGIIVKLEKPKGDLERLADVIFGSVGLSGVMGLIALLVGVLVGGLLFWLRSRRETDESEGRFRL